MQPFDIANDSLDHPPPVDAAGEVDLTLVTLRFDAADPGALAGVLAAYVVTSRNESGCRNIDLCVGVGAPSRFVVIEKWESPEAQRRHFDGDAMIAMAQSCNGLLRSAPAIELLEGISAHDLA